MLAGAACVELDVWERNPGAARLYRKFGFVPAGRRAFRSPSGEVTGYDIIMRRYAEGPSGC
jgi:ribosomal protein S18 acetylase RimI-like enzyme